MGESVIPPAHLLINVIDSGLPDLLCPYPHHLKGAEGSLIPQLISASPLLSREGVEVRKVMTFIYPQNEKALG